MSMRRRRFMIRRMRLEGSQQDSSVSFVRELKFEIDQELLKKNNITFADYRRFLDTMHQNRANGGPFMLDQGMEELF
ncbi:hypothetical protein FGO68_gene2206 [Halteria grandinella]|uniref:Uncharacterized protein n=1 Tax=Halteria grandinella TaxID=5974 RepID=A0A8J8NCI8_HALGN|nr:hypothetical protein FGO68_gene2206 [Halteria grandinella]